MSVIPKEKLGGYQRWQINSFDQKPATPPPPPPVAPLIDESSVVTTEETVATVDLPTAEDIERIHEEARKTGYDAGFAEGQEAAIKEGEAVIEQAMASVNSLIGNIEQALGELDQSVAQQVLDLALEVARQMTRGAIKAQSDYLLPIIREALTSLPLHHAHVTLHLNPADADTVRSSMGEQLSQQNTQIFENDQITPGGCRVTAGASEIDATTETRWQRVLEAIGTEPQAWLTTK